MCLFRRLFRRHQEENITKAPKGVICSKCKKELQDDTNYSLLPTLNESEIKNEYFCGHCAIEEWEIYKRGYKQVCDFGYDSPYLCAQCKKCSKEKRIECLKKINKEN